MINPPIYRLTTAVSDIDQTNINRDIRDGNWLSTMIFNYKWGTMDMKPTEKVWPAFVANS